MDGPAIFKTASKILPDFLKRLFASTQFSLADLKLVIPHQASILALELMKRRFEFTDQQFFMNIRERGNMVAASIPVALSEAIEQKRIERGDLVLLIGTSAGFSVGGMILRY
jgi:3-oxoacyl-[acyl-carrier-protein] synthase-3